MSEPLFTKPPNKIIIAHDIFEKPHKRNLKNFMFRASAYGILKVDGKILLKRHPLITKLEIPGGGIEIEETIEQGLIREFKEETGLKVKPTKLIFADDSFFTTKERDAHGILLFYIVKKVSGKLEANFEDSEEVKFMPISDLSKDNLHKAFWGLLKFLKETY